MLQCWENRCQVGKVGKLKKMVNQTTNNESVQDEVLFILGNVPLKYINIYYFDFSKQYKHPDLFFQTKILIIQSINISSQIFTPMFLRLLRKTDPI